MNAITLNPGPPAPPSGSTSLSSTSVRPNDVRRESASRQTEFGPTLDKAQQAIERNPNSTGSSPGDESARSDTQTDTASEPAAVERTTASALGQQATAPGLVAGGTGEKTEPLALATDAESTDADDRIQAANVGDSLSSASASLAPDEPVDGVTTETPNDHREAEPDSEGTTNNGTPPAHAGDIPTGAYGDHAGVANLSYRNLQHPAAPEATVAEAPTAAGDGSDTTAPAAASSSVHSADGQGSGEVTTQADPSSPLSSTIDEESDTPQNPAVASPGTNADKANTAPGRNVPTTTASVEAQGSESSAEAPSATKSGPDPTLVSDMGGRDIAPVVTREAAVRAVESLSSPDQLTTDAPLDETAETQLWSQVQRAFSRVRTNLDGQELRIRLRPAELGELLVQVQTLGEQLSVRLVASSAAAQQTLLNDRQRLAAELAEAGFDQGFVDITRDDDPADNRQADNGDRGGPGADGRRTLGSTRRRSDDAITLTGERRPNSDRHPHLGVSRPRAGSTVSLTL